MDARTTALFSHARNGTYVYLWTSQQFQQVQVEWCEVNKLLQHHGFKPVCFSDPVENKNISDLVLLDRKSCDQLRTTLGVMLTDSERRQALVQELVKSNNQLKEEVQEHASRAAQQTGRAAELEALLDEVRTRVQDLEDRYLGKALERHGDAQQLQREKQEAQRQVLALEQQLSERSEEVARLQRKLYFAIKEEEQRRTRQDQASRKIRTDQQVLQSQLQVGELKREVQHLRDQLQRRSPEELPAGGELTDNRAPEPRLCSHSHHVLRSPTPYTLASMVSHFQKLFDVASLNGVYPRMNEVYSQLGEMTNALRNLRDVLGLDGRVSTTAVVSHVARLASSTERASELGRLLGDGDLDRIILKVKQHEEFFPAFHSLVTDILQTLGVSLLDDVLPALRRLTQTTTVS